VIGIDKRAAVTSDFILRLPEPVDFIRLAEHLADSQKSDAGSGEDDGQNHSPYLTEGGHGRDDEKKYGDVNTEFEKFDFGGMAINGQRARNEERGAESYDWLRAHSSMLHALSEGLLIEIIGIR
jgi:hypothetical protein